MANANPFLARSLSRELNRAAAYTSLIVRLSVKAVQMRESGDVNAWHKLNDACDYLRLARDETSPRNARQFTAAAVSCAIEVNA